MIKRSVCGFYFVAQVDNDSFGSFCSYALDAFEPGVFASGDYRGQLGGIIGREDCARCVGAYAADAYEQAEEVALLGCGEAEEVAGVFADNLVDEGLDFGAVLESGVGRQRYSGNVADASCLDDNVGGGQLGDGAADIFYHGVSRV